MALLVSLVSPAPTVAGVIYASSGYDLFAFPLRSVEDFVGQNTLGVSETLNSFSSPPQGTFIGSATASAAIQATSDNFIRLASQATVGAASPAPFANSRIYASYRDRITYLGADAPESLTLTFRFSGILGFSRPLVGGPQTGGLSTFQIAGRDGFNFASSGIDGVTLRSGFTFGPPEEQQLTLSLSERLTFAPGDVIVDGSIVTFQGSYSFGTTRVGTNQYEYSITASAYDEILRDLGVTAFTEASHTISLAGISSPDGSTVDPGLLNFESGFSFQPAAVPEPSTLVLAAIGSAGLLASGRRRVARVVTTGRLPGTH